MAEIEQADLTTLTVELLSAFVSNNTIEGTDLAGLIQSTHAALSSINAPRPPEPAVPEFEPAVSIRKSLGSREHILSLIDGKPYKTLKRHLSGHGLTPAEYRARYKLPGDYPMVAPSYSEQRRDVAQRLGLGRKSVKKAEPEAVVAEKPATSIPDATPAVAAPRTSKRAATAPATVEQAKPKATPSTPKPAKAKIHRATRAGAPIASDADTATPAKSVEPALAQAAVASEPTTVAKVKLPKPAAPKSTASKAKRDAPGGSQTESKPAPAKRGRPKASKTPAPTE